MKLGVCYYPEHWPQTWWRDDAKAMVDLGITRVRIAEFAWSRMEPSPDAFTWDWLDRAIDVLGEAGLEVVMCTPTATPPKWLIDRHPEILAIDKHGRPRVFGSRRHYCFSSLIYRAQSARITRAVAQRYGQHDAVKAWQTDNEYGCHDTIVSYSEAARAGFRTWLEARYGDIATLNAEWGNVFWSQEYRSFSEIDPPVMTVTEANPAHRLDYQRFASDEVAAFNWDQAQILRALSPGRDIVHNFMGAFTQFDHFDVAQDLDVATWDSYPLGFLEQGAWDDAIKQRYLRQGHPDFTAFHHDLYRGVGRGRWQIMEQQPGPVNWAPWNPAPLPGMVRAWTWEGFAHGAEVVSYFRWRQAPFAQEQMHAGLNLPDRTPAPAFAEVRQCAQELKIVGAPKMRQAPVALLFDYQAQWMTDIQPQGRDFSYFELVLAFYGAARRLGLDVDVVAANTDLAGYEIVLAPSLPVLTEGTLAACLQSGAQCVFGPRTGAKSENFSSPETLPPSTLRDVLPLRIVRVESLRRGFKEPAGAFVVSRWLEHVESALAPRAKTDRGAGLWFSQKRMHYLACWPCATLLDRVLRECAAQTGLEALDLPLDVRLRARGDLQFAFNYGPETIDLSTCVPGAENLAYVLGAATLPPAGVAAWRRPNARA
jgi:beta-galactosidase